MVLPRYLAWNMLALESAKLIRSEIGCPMMIYEDPFTDPYFMAISASHDGPHK